MAGSIGLTPTGLAIDNFLSGLGTDKAARNAQRRITRFVHNFTAEAKKIHTGVPNPVHVLMVLRRHYCTWIHENYGWYRDGTLWQLLTEYVRELTTMGWRPTTRTQVAKRLSTYTHANSATA